MQNEISSGTMLGIVLIALAAVIGLGFGVFSIAKGVSNEGVVNVQDNLTAVTDSSFDDYDNKIVTGTQLQAAYKNFQGKPVAILVQTQAMKKAVKNNPGHKSYVFEIGSADADGKPDVYINYNAILGADATGTAPTSKGGTTAPVSITDGTKGVLSLEEPYTITGLGFSIDNDGKVLYDSNIGGFSKAGNCEFISSSAKFETRVVKDASGTKVGVVFKQLAK